MRNRPGQSPREKLMNDPTYNHLVCTLESFIENAHFTPSELREACILACVNYEMRHIRQQTMPLEVDKALNTLDEFVNRRSKY